MRAAALAALLLCASSAHAHGPETERVLAVAFVAEAGWADSGHPAQEADHRGIFHVLWRRWLTLRERYPDRFGSLKDVVTTYVAAFDSRARGPRLVWLRALAGRPAAEDAEAPAGWPSQRARWSAHLEWWETALARARDCLHRRRCADPYAREEPIHWGGEMDTPPPCTRALPRRDTVNIFYARIPGCTAGVIRASVAR